MATVSSLAQRIKSIEWGQDETRARSHYVLAREFARRSALWAQELDCLLDWPFFDIAQIIDPEVRADPALATEVAQSLATQFTSRMADYVVQWALNFAALPEVKYDLPDPYEPLLIMFERGGTFNLEMDVMNIDFMGGGVWIGDWREHLSTEPLTTLEKEELDALDMPQK